MSIGKVWIYQLLFVCNFVCVCTVEDFSAEDKAMKTADRPKVIVKIGRSLQHTIINKKFLNTDFDSEVAERPVFLRNGGDIFLLSDCRNGAVITDTFDDITKQKLIITNNKSSACAEISNPDLED